MWIIILLVLTACSSGGGSRSNIDYRTGSQALEMRFLQPHVEVIEREDLTLILQLANKGTWNIRDGEIFIKGYDPAYFTLRFDPNNRFTIDGKSIYDPYGELTQTIVISDPSVRMPQNRGRFRQDIQAIGCYIYRTQTSVPICIDPDPADSRAGSKICRTTPVSPGAQGHPVAVTYVDPRVGRQDVRFTIEVQNVGNGIIFDKRISNEKCAFDLKYQETNKVYLINAAYSNNVLECSPENPISLSNNGKGIFTCICRNCVNPVDGAFQTVLNIELEYGYRNTQTASITVVSENY